MTKHEEQLYNYRLRRMEFLKKNLQGTSIAKLAKMEGISTRNMARLIAKAKHED